LPVTTIIILAALAAVAILAAPWHRQERRDGWLTFGVWAAAGFFSAFATISFALGLLVLPVALVAIFGASRLSLWPAGLGFVAGIGLMCVLVSALNVGESGGPDPYSWLIVGVVLSAASIAAFSRTQRALRA
jgi:hypothetical protein